jgi:hypothetical protein
MMVVGEALCTYHQTYTVSEVSTVIEAVNVLFAEYINVFETGRMLPHFSKVSVAVVTPCQLQLCYSGQPASWHVIYVGQCRDFLGSCFTNEGTK